MSSKRILYLYGGTGSGKTTLLRLLDGHPEVAVTPLHDKLITAFEQYGQENIPIDKTSLKVNGEKRANIHKIKGILSKSRYHRLQEIHHGRPVRMLASSRNIKGKDMGGFNFYSFEEKWINKINLDKSIKVEKLIYSIFDSLFQEWGDYPYNKDVCKYYIGLGRPSVSSMEYLLGIPKARIIFLQRDPRGCIASKKQKSEVKGIDILRNRRIINTVRLQDASMRLKKEYPNRVKIVQFERLIKNHKEVSSSVAEFLGITDSQVLNNPTFCGEKTQVEFTGEVKDRWEDILTEEEVELANLQTGNFSLKDIKYRSIKNYIMSLHQSASSKVRRILN
jgi:energy-coupling factor transporter ATP-binding protein EcfA2